MDKETKRWMIVVLVLIFIPLLGGLLSRVVKMMEGPFSKIPGPLHPALTPAAAELVFKYPGQVGAKGAPDPADTSTVEGRINKKIREEGYEPLP